jgi:hypothetical protein
VQESISRRTVGIGVFRNLLLIHAGRAKNWIASSARSQESHESLAEEFICSEGPSTILPVATACFLSPTSPMSSRCGLQRRTQ